MDLYFELYDGKAVTCDDFLHAMSKANNKDLSSLHRWYGQSGTPEVKITTNYNEEDKTYTMFVEQRTPPTAGQADKVPLLIPLKMGLLGPDGKEMPLKLKGSEAEPVDEIVLEFDTAEETYTFVDVMFNPVPSILRSFSAPVKLEIAGQTDADLVFLFANDSDEFNRQGFFKSKSFSIKNVLTGGMLVSAWPRKSLPTSTMRLLLPRVNLNSAMFHRR